MVNDRVGFGTHELPIVNINMNNKRLKYKGEFINPVFVLMSIFLFQSPKKLKHELGSSSKHSKVLVCLIAKYII